MLAELKRHFEALLEEEFALQDLERAAAASAQKASSRQTQLLTSVAGVPQCCLTSLSLCSCFCVQMLRELLYNVTGPPC